jgi:hypothetical protein
MSTPAVWDETGAFLRDIGASLETCMFTAVELERENIWRCETVDGGARRFHASRFLRKCGWRVKPDFERLYPTHEARLEKLASLSADVLDSDQEFALWRWLLRKLA